MFKASHGQELVLRLPNEVGSMSQVTKIIAERGVSVLALSSSVEYGEAVLRFITDDNLRAGDALRHHDYNPLREDVVLVECSNKPGMLSSLTQALEREDIDLERLYVSASAHAERAAVVLRSSDDAHALVMLNEVMAR